MFELELVVIFGLVPQGLDLGRGVPLDVLIFRRVHAVDDRVLKGWNGQVVHASIILQLGVDVNRLDREPMRFEIVQPTRHHPRLHQFIEGGLGLIGDLDPVDLGRHARLDLCTRPIRELGQEFEDLGSEVERLRAWELTQPQTPGKSQDLSQGTALGSSNPNTW